MSKGEQEVLVEPVKKQNEDISRRSFLKKLMSLAGAVLVGTSAVGSVIEGVNAAQRAPAEKEAQENESDVMKLLKKLVKVEPFGQPMSLSLLFNKSATSSTVMTGFRSFSRKTDKSMDSEANYRARGFEYDAEDKRTNKLLEKEIPLEKVFDLLNQYALDRQKNKAESVMGVKLHLDYFSVVRFMKSDTELSKQYDAFQAMTLEAIRKIINEQKVQLMGAQPNLDENFFKQELDSIGFNDHDLHPTLKYVAGQGFSCDWSEMEFTAFSADNALFLNPTTHSLEFITSLPVTTQLDPEKVDQINGAWQKLGETLSAKILERANQVLEN